jgi:O-antigen ligase
MTVLTETPATVRPVPTGKLIRTWFILLPMLYFSNSGFPGAADSDTAAGVSRTHQAGLLLVCLISSAFILKRVQVIAAASLRVRLVMALPLLSLLSCLWSVDAKQSLISAVTLLCFTFFAIYLAETFTFNGQLDLIMVTGVVAVTLSILLALFIPSVGATSSGWRGMFTHKQQCAASVTLFLVTALHWKPNRPIQKPLRFIYVLMCLLVIGMSQSRTGWLLTVLALVLSVALWGLQRFAAKDSLFLLLTAIPIAGGILYLLKLAATLILTSVGKDATLSERTVIWAAVWVAITQHPWLGYGYEAFWRGLAGASKNVVLISGWNISQAQSGYLDLWLQFGISGIVLLVLMTGQAARNAISSFRGTDNSVFVRWCVVIIICNLAYNIGESDFGYLRVVWLMFVLACIGLQKEASTVRGARVLPERPGAAISQVSRAAVEF